jgi:nicotinate-nucleotide adenylyltransferase
VAREAARQFDLSRILFVPASRPPHKSGATSAGYEDRYKMVEIACHGETLFEPSRLESRGGSSYSIHTIEKVRAGLAPGCELHFLIGADAFAEIRTWYRWRDVLRLVDFIVVTRPGHRYTTPPGARVYRLDSLALAVSSSALRARLAAGESPAEVPPAVLHYIREKGLYQDKTGAARGPR